jgi:hypothetical protein
MTEAPSANIQTPVNFQAPRNYTACLVRFGYLSQLWFFSGAWMLELGA